MCLVRSQAARLVRAGAGRSVQLNAGAEAASGDVLLFLHADVVLPPDVALQIRESVEGEASAATSGCGTLGGGLLGRWLEALAPFSRSLGCYYGDSGIFVRRDMYEQLGGFPEISVMEDVAFVRKLERSGQTAYLSGSMISSSRRWEGRSVRTLLFWGFMQAAFALGVSPWRLASFYKTHDLKWDPEPKVRA